MKSVKIKAVLCESSFARFVFVSLFFLTAGNAVCGTYYIDCVNGKDANNGTSMSSPWLHHPYMVGWSGSYTHVAGDQFIFKGGVVCPVSYLPLTLGAGGASGNVDFYGANTNWYTGSSWTRPIFDGGSTGPAGNMFNGGSYNYWTVDSIEFRNQMTGANYRYAVYGTGTGLTANNLYIHGWSLGTTCASGDDDKQGGVYFAGGGSTNTLSNSTIDGTGTGPVGGAYQGPIAFGNTFGNIPNGIINATATAYNNTIYNIVASCDTTQHENAIETLSNSTTSLIYNNLIYNVSVGVVIDVCGNTTMYNNIIYNNTPYDIQIDTNCGSDSSANAVLYNNTLQSTGGLVRVINRGSTLGSLTLNNNHYITDASGDPACYNNTGGGCSNVTTVVDDYGMADTVTMTNSVATAQGYVPSNNYAPTTANGGTVKVALDLTTACTNSSIGSALCTAMLGVPRPVASSWNAGAYQFAPNPPTSLSAAAH